MCRRYEYYFPNECQHTHRSPDWYFPCSDPTTCLSLTIEALNSPHHCPECLSQYQHPPEAHAYANLPLDREQQAKNVFARAVEHHRLNPSGDLHFPQWDIEVFRQFQVRISPADRKWLQETEEDMNRLIWAQVRDPQADPPPFPDRMLVLQMRDAHHHARVLELEEQRQQEARLPEIAARVHARNVARIQGLLTPVPVEDAAICDICSDPYAASEVGSQPKEIAVRLPCGHVFGQTCIENWLQMYNRACPFCRRSFGLLEAEEADRQAELDALMENVLLEYPTPFWIKMLMGS